MGTHIDIKPYKLVISPPPPSVGRWVKGVPATVMKRYLQTTDEAGNSIEYNRFYYMVIYLQEDWAGADRWSRSFVQIILH